MTERIRVLVADDHPIVHLGVRMLLENEPDIEVVGEALNGCDALTLAENLQPDVVLMDIGMPDMDGLEATRLLKKRWPDIQVLVLTVHRTDDYFFEMLKAGASGYVLKGAQATELVNALQTIISGEVFLYPVVASRLVKGFIDREGKLYSSNATLSTREMEVLRLLADGYSTNEIAKELVLSPSTVYTHRRNLMGKLGLSTRRELMEYARQQGLV
jgi:two-component system response regulator NreC